MAADLKALLRRLADELEKEEAAEEAGKSTEQFEKRIAELEARIARAPADEREDAIEELTDEEWQIILEHRGQGGEQKPKPKPRKEKEEPPARRTRPGRKSGQAYDWTVDDAGNVSRVDIAHIYNGEDEPDEVELPDDDQAAA